MSRTVRVLRRAQRDLLEIREYVAWDDPAAAQRVVEGLVTAIESLADLPERGARPREARLRRMGYRFLVQGRYLVFYKVLRAQVRVYRVLHGSRAYSDLL